MQVTKTKDLKWYLPCEYKSMRNVENIKALYALATVTELAEGLQWYTSANQAAQLLADRYHVSIEVSAAVIAVLSPAVPWAYNVGIAEIVLNMAQRGVSADDYVIQGYRKNKHKAHTIATTHDTSLVSGEKVTSFYRNILNPLSDDVTVDRHAIKVWLGMVDGGSVRFHSSVYDVVADDYRQAAKELDIPVASLQAVVWLVYKRIVER